MFILTCIVFSQIFLLSNNLWYDELCTTPLILGYDPLEIISEVRFDSHPPLYFIFLKIYTMIFGNSIVIMKTFNILLVVIFAVVSYYFLHQNINRKFAVIFATILSFFPALSNEVFQVRMYIMAPLFVSLTAMMAYKVYVNSNRVISTILFLFFTALSMYTHYYALTCVIIIHIYLYIILLKLNFINYKNIFLYALTSIFLFLPWFPTFFDQLSIKFFNNGDKSSVYDKIVKNAIYLFYTGNRAFQNNKADYIFTIVLISTVFFVVVSYIINQKRLKEKSMFYIITKWSLFIPFIMILFFIMVSVIWRPVWYSRYILVYWPMIAFGLACIVYESRRSIKIIFFLVVLICFVRKIDRLFLVASNDGLTRYSNLARYEFNNGDCILDGDLYTSTYFKDVPQYNLKSGEVKHWGRHVYWNVILVDNYNILNFDKMYFYSTILKADSIYAIGKKKYILNKSFHFNYIYDKKGLISLYQYKLK